MREGRIEMTATTWTVGTDGGGRVSIVPRPRGGGLLAEDVLALREAGVDLLISALAPLEADQLGLAGEGAAAAAAGLGFRSLPITDMGVPADMSAFLGALGEIANRVRDGEHVAVHCYASRGRSGIISSLLLTLCGWDVGEALDTLSAVRGYRVPETAEQRAWVRRAAEQIHSGT